MAGTWLTSLTLPLALTSLRWCPSRTGLSRATVHGDQATQPGIGCDLGVTEVQPGGFQGDDRAGPHLEQ